MMSEFSSIGYSRTKLKRYLLDRTDDKMFLALLLEVFGDPFVHSVNVSTRLFGGVVVVEILSPSTRQTKLRLIVPSESSFCIIMAVRLI